MQCVSHCDALDPSKRRNFEQPVWQVRSPSPRNLVRPTLTQRLTLSLRAQTANMFLGETFCLIAFSFLNSRLNPFKMVAKRRRAAAFAAKPNYDDSGVSLQNEPLLGDDDVDVEHGDAHLKPHGVAAAAGAGPEKVDWRKALLFWTPAVCDILGTTCMNIGLFFVPVSIYQMLRGALVLWVGVFSVVFLKRDLTRAQWVALVVCMFGVGVVGSSSLIGNDKGPEAASEDAGVSPLVGVALVLVAQIFSASSFLLPLVLYQREADSWPSTCSCVAVRPRGAHHGAPHGRASRASASSSSSSRPLSM